MKTIYTIHESTSYTHPPARISFNLQIGVTTRFCSDIITSKIDGCDTKLDLLTLQLWQNLRWTVWWVWGLWGSRTIVLTLKLKSIRRPSIPRSASSIPHTISARTHSYTYILSIASIYDSKSWLYIHFNDHIQLSHIMPSRLLFVFLLSTSVLSTVSALSCGVRGTLNQVEQQDIYPCSRHAQVSPLVRLKMPRVYPVRPSQSWTTSASRTPAMWPQHWARHRTSIRASLCSTTMLDAQLDAQLSRFSRKVKPIFLWHYWLVTMIASEGCGTRSCLAAEIVKYIVGIRDRLIAMFIFVVSIFTKRYSHSDGICFLVNTNRFRSSLPY